MLNSGSIGISAFLLYVAPAILWSSVIKGTSGTVGSLMSPKSVVTISGAYLMSALDQIKTRIPSSNGFLSSPSVYRHDSQSAALCFIPLRWPISNSNSGGLRHHRAKFPVASAMVKIHRIASFSI